MERTVEYGSFVSSTKLCFWCFKSGTAPLRTGQFVVSKWRATVGG